MTEADPFDFSTGKNALVAIRWQGQHVTTLRGKDAARFLARIAATDAAGAQLLMAKATGNFKRGNERLAKEKGR
jgi:hypothetical protein